ncbi:transcriptional repressor [Eubacteriales bacterium OttesenSCG-928-N14]|nr:transcriptional repressor [Eubacteriales bacterium OttesenSCG-928-N14]
MNRNSKQRNLVLEAVQQGQSHVTADEVYAVVRSQCPQISLGTVYRNLGNLASDGSIQRIHVPGSGDRFDKTIAPHAHFHCNNCGALLDFDATSAQDALQQAVQNSEHRIDSHSVLFEGICSSCLKTPS